MNLGPHAAFIVSAYGAATLIVGALIVWIVLDYVRLRRALSELDARGVSRRSEQASEGAL